MNAHDPAFADDATLEVRDVSVWYGPKVALSELSCSFGPGVTGLLGPNGAGKTTLMRAMTGLISPNTGSVTLLGSDPRSDREVQPPSPWCRRTKPCRQCSRPASS
jgi:ABC-type multidrug transport system ATPase subunit